ncbi:MAG TPA: hypothetical protein VHA78_00960 [Candidatus Peribacteraceae bacterium]|nr:hypothetical protein [Candidatus Peribacteraceae bacterium]
MNTHDTPPPKRSLLRRLKGWLGSAEPKAPEAAEQSVHQTIIETPVTPVQSIITPELPVQTQSEPHPHLQKSPVAAPKAVRKKRAAAPKAKKQTAKKEVMQKEEKKPLPKQTSADLLAVLPVETNLIGRAPVEIMIDGKKHVLAFRNEHIILDGNNYHISKGSVTLDIDDAKRIGTHLDLVVGAFGRTETLVFEAEDIEEMFSVLLTHGTYKNEDKDLVITRF